MLAGIILSLRRKIVFKIQFKFFIQSITYSKLPVLPQIFVVFKRSMLWNGVRYRMKATFLQAKKKLDIEMFSYSNV